MYVDDKHLGSLLCKMLGTILKMDKEGTQTKDQRRRKLMTMHGDGIGRLYVRRKKRTYNY